MATKCFEPSLFFFSIMVQVIQDIMTAKLNIGMHVENAKTRNRNK